MNVNKLKNTIRVFHKLCSEMFNKYINAGFCIHQKGTIWRECISSMLKKAASEENMKYIRFPLLNQIFSFVFL